MKTDKVVDIGFDVGEKILSWGSEEKITAYLLNTKRIYVRILFTLAEYLTIYSRKFNRVSFYFTDHVYDVFPNGTLSGIIGKINRSEIDVGVQPFIMDEVSVEIVNFAYPFKLHSHTFVTHKADYKPQIYGILQTFSLSLWIAIISILIAMSLVYFVTFKKKYTLDKILLHTFAVLIRQSSVVKPSSMIENVLVFSWVAGAMFLCLAYDSVFLSFLAFPPTTQIKDVPQLAKAVKEGHYHCIGPRQSGISDMLLKSNDENFRIIRRDLETNNLSNPITFREFFLDITTQNLAFLVPSDVVDILTIGKKFVSEDRFLETMAAMPVRKGFCCKKLVEKFVHRLMASGLYFKYENDASFVLRMPRLLTYEEKDNNKRKLTVTDVTAAFIFLIFGYILSLLILLVEILTNHLKKNK